MKLSGIKGEDNALLLANLLEPIGEIAIDPKYANVFPIQAKKNETAQQAFVRFSLTTLPEMLRDHKHAVCEILSIVSGKPADDMTFIDILKGVNELIQDEVFTSFFSSAATKKDTPLQSDTSEK